MMKVSYATMEAMGMLVKRLGQDARRLEKALAETMNASAEWKRIAEELKKERNALRAATIDTAAGSLLDAFGSLANEPRHGATDDEYRDRIVTKIHTIKLERDALRAEFEALKKERDNLWQREGIEQKRRIDVEEQLSDTLADLGALLGVDGSVRSITAAIENLKERNVELSAERERMKAELAVVRDERDTLRKERDALRADVADLRTLCDQWKQRETELLAEIDRLKKPARNHPVAVGEWVRRTDAECDGIYFGRGVIAQVIDIHDAPEKQYTVSRPEWNGYCVPWAMQYCEPCDPPEATHDTPEGKQIAESAVKREPKPGDKVRLVREPSHTDIPAMLPWSKAFGMPGDTAIVVIMAVPDKVPSGTIPVRTGMGRCFFWPISCIEIVEDAK